MIALLAAVVSISVPTNDCRVMRIAKAAGEVVEEADSRAASCSSASIPPKLRYDARQGVAVAKANLAEGEPLGRVYLPPRPAVLRGDPIKLEARIGNVTIQRSVTAMQPSMPRQRFFVRDARGKIIRAPLLSGEMAR